MALFFFTNLVYRDLIKNYSIYIVYAPIQVYGENVFSLKFRVKITVSTKSMVYGKELHRLIFYQIFSQKFFFNFHYYHLFKKNRKNPSTIHLNY